MGAVGGGRLVKKHVEGGTHTDLSLLLEITGPLRG